MVTQVSNKPTNLSIQNFLSKVSALGGPAKPCRFAVRITPRESGGGTNNLLNLLPYSSKLSDLTYVCDAVEFPGRGFQVTNFRYYGPSQVVPTNSEYGPCNISLLCHNSGFERQFFDDWQNIVNPTNSFNFNYPKEYYCDVEIFQLSEYTTAGAFNQASTFEQVSMVKTPEVIYNWKLHMAWPTFVSPQQVTWADSADVLRLQITLAYKYWDRPGNDTFYTRSSNSVTNPAAQILTNYISKQ
jgi:hypothetical protein